VFHHWKAGRAYIASRARMHAGTYSRAIVRLSNSLTGDKEHSFKKWESLELINNSNEAAFLYN
jgi:hypothetical protein